MLATISAWLRGPQAKSPQLVKHERAELFGIKFQHKLTFLKFIRPKVRGSDAVMVQERQWRHRVGKVCKRSRWWK